MYYTHTWQDRITKHRYASLNLINKSNKFERDGRALLGFTDCRQTVCFEEGAANNNINAVSATDVSRLLVYAIFSSSTGTVL